MKYLFLAMLLSAIGFATAVHAQSPYAGEESREIKSLSRSKIDGYLQGHGMGYAKAAELNHYPGPRHVLDLADELALTDEQIEQTQSIFERMKTKAIDLGTQLVEKEAELDRRFADGSIDATSLEALVTDIAMLEAEIRIAHLSAHLEQEALLSGEQIQLYDKLRGYGATVGEQHSHSQRIPSLRFLISFPVPDQYHSTYSEVKQALTMSQSAYTPLLTTSNTPLLGQN